MVVTVLWDRASMMKILLLWPAPITATPAQPRRPPAFTVSKSGDTVPSGFGTKPAVGGAGAGVVPAGAASVVAA